MLFDNQFIIKAKTAWEQDMGVRFTKEKRDGKIDRAHCGVTCACLPDIIQSVGGRQCDM